MFYTMPKGEIGINDFQPMNVFPWPNYGIKPCLRLLGVSGLVVEMTQTP